MRQWPLQLWHFHVCSLQRNRRVESTEGSASSHRGRGIAVQSRLAGRDHQWRTAWSSLLLIITGCLIPGAAWAIDLAGSNQTIGSLSGNETVTNSGPGAATLTAGGDNSSTLFSGIIQNGAAVTGLTKAGHRSPDALGCRHLQRRHHGEPGWTFYRQLDRAVGRDERHGRGRSHADDCRQRLSRHRQLACGRGHGGDRSDFDGQQADPAGRRRHDLLGQLRRQRQPVPRQCRPPHADRHRRLVGHDRRRPGAVVLRRHRPHDRRHGAYRPRPGRGPYSGGRHVDGDQWRQAHRRPELGQFASTCSRGGLEHQRWLDRVRLRPYRRRQLRRRRAHHQRRRHAEQLCRRGDQRGVRHACRDRDWQRLDLGRHRPSRCRRGRRRRPVGHRRRPGDRQAATS